MTNIESAIRLGQVCAMLATIGGRCLQLAWSLGRLGLRPCKKDLYWLQHELMTLSQELDDALRIENDPGPLGQVVVKMPKPARPGARTPEAKEARRVERVSEATLAQKMRAARRATADLPPLRPTPPPKESGAAWRQRRREKVLGVSHAETATQ